MTKAGDSELRAASDKSGRSPEIPAARLFALLEGGYRLGPFDLLPRPADLVALPEIFEGAVAVLAALAENRIRRGLYRHHVEEPADLEFNSPITRSEGVISRIFGQDPYLRCHYDCMHADFEDNAVLLWTLCAASKADLRRNDLADRVRHGYETLAGRMPLTPENAIAGLQRFYDRLERGGRPIHGLCRLILEQPGAQMEGVNRPALVQAFLSEWLKQTLSADYAVRETYDVGRSREARSPLGIDIRSTLSIADRASKDMVFSLSVEDVIETADGLSIDGHMFDLSAEPSDAADRLAGSIGLTAHAPQNTT